ncbi:MAG: hypothetical protein ACFFDN_14425, partial [Candidatus Hodarchaeota archaeon]
MKNSIRCLSLFLVVLLLIIILPIVSAPDGTCGEDNYLIESTTYKKVKEPQIYKEEILKKIVPNKRPEERLDEINKKIKEKGAKWQAGLTPTALLSVEEKRELLGSFILPDEEDNIETVTIETDGLSLPSTFDWRDYNGEDWMTSVKNQAS